MSLFNAANKYDYNITNRSQKKRERDLATPDDAHSISTTSTLNGDTLTTSSSLATSSIHTRPFLARCLLIRALHEQCGHVVVLGLHETPCTILHYGIVPATSGLGRASCCQDMACHLVIKRSCCEECRPEARKRGLGLGWGKEREMGTEKVALPVKTVVETRERWRREVEGQRRRIEARRGKGESRDLEGVLIDADASVIEHLPLS